MLEKVLKNKLYIVLLTTLILSVLILSVFPPFMFSYYYNCRWDTEKEDGYWDISRLHATSRICVPFGKQILKEKKYDIVGLSDSAMSDGDWEYLISIPDEDINYIKNRIIELGGGKITEKKYFYKNFYKNLTEDKKCRNIAYFEDFDLIKECLFDNNIYVYLYDTFYNTSDSDGEYVNYIYIYMDTKNGKLFIKEHSI